MLAQVSIKAVVMVFLVVVTQVLGSTLLVKTNGFRELWWTLGCLAVYAVSFYILAETIRQGMALSLVMPILAASVPLVTIAVAIMFLGEQASMLRLGLLVSACLLIGVAATV